MRDSLLPNVEDQWLTGRPARVEALQRTGVTGPKHIAVLTDQRFGEKRQTSEIGGAADILWGNAAFIQHTPIIGYLCIDTSDKGLQMTGLNLLYFFTTGPLATLQFVQRKQQAAGNGSVDPSHAAPVINRWYTGA